MNDKTQIASGAPAQTANPGSPEADAADAADLTGVTLLNRYKISKRLGEGGMGTVYLGEHTTIRKKFAIKVLSKDFAHKPDLVQRFLQEARAASMITQQNVVEISDFGDTPDGSVFFVMEYLDGEDVAGTLKREGALPWSRIVTIMVQVCDALQAAHDVGIIHRDMKPENCFRITRAGNPDFIKVLDFGIAKVTDADGEGKGLTRTGMIFGTPEYMSPEQAQGKKVDSRVDVYAAGVIMFELLTGRVPFKGETFMAILTKHMFEVPEAPSAVNPNNGITAEMEAIVLKAMQKERDYRFATMDELKAAILAVGTGAQAVDVVAENIARPEGGQMSFTGGYNAGTRPPHSAGAVPGTYPPPGGGTYPGQQGPQGGTYPPPGGTYPPPGGTHPPQGGTYPPQGGTYPPGTQPFGTVPQQRSPVTLVAAGVALLGLAGGGAYFAVSQTPTAPVQAAADVDSGAQELADATDSLRKATAAAAAERDKKVIAAETPTVTFRIETDIVAQIVDARDGALYGMTNDPDGVKVEKSGDALALALIAEGYERLDFEILPNRDKVFEKAMTPLKAAATSRTGRSGTTQDAAPDDSARPSGSGSAPALPSGTKESWKPSLVDADADADAKKAEAAKKKKAAAVKKKAAAATKKKTGDRGLMDPDW